MHEFKFFRQLNAMDCGPTCLRMIARYYGKNLHSGHLRDQIGMNKEGVSLLGLSDVAEDMGFRARGVQLSYDQLVTDISSPTILHWNQNHFVIYLPGKRSGTVFGKIKIADPAKGIIKYSPVEFQQHWHSNVNESGTLSGIALLLEPTATFYDKDFKRQNISWGLISNYLMKGKWQVAKIFFALIFVSSFQLITPFLTQSIVDTGIQTQNLQYVIIVLLAQLMLLFSRSVIEFVRSRILLRLSVKINFSLLSDFWIKLTQLPMSYFDRYHTGDTLQRLGDSKKIENFFTGTLLTTIVSFFTFWAFAVVLSLYNSEIFLIFLAGSALYFLWIRLFLRFRRKINLQTFTLSAAENSVSLQLVQGMQELKLNGAEQSKRWEWENIQSAIFKLSFKNLSYTQLQQIGALFINEGKNVVITFLVAQMVIEGKLTLGAMLAVQYIIGQLSSPVEQFIGFIQSGQDAKISLERLNDIYSLKDEQETFIGEGVGLTQLPGNASILISKLSFTYPGAGNDSVLKEINLLIPQGKTTAIVGTSGSGKTTLVKILLKFYSEFEGAILMGQFDNKDSNVSTGAQFRFIDPKYWRKQCGAVLQDGVIFNDSIAGNIAIGHDRPDYETLMAACQTANILSFIESLPNGFHTKLGTNGMSLSQGQKQRLLIARAVYRNPKFIFFDEATNALDANTEKVIVENLNVFFKDRTVVVVAHRLSTVKNADQIVVLHGGRIVEAGKHSELTNLRGMYFELVKNQLELGNS